VIPGATKPMHLKNTPQLTGTYVHSLAEAGYPGKQGPTTGLVARAQESGGVGRA
jgi:hypothetical protein